MPFVVLNLIFGQLTFIFRFLDETRKNEGVDAGAKWIDSFQKVSKAACICLTDTVTDTGHGFEMIRTHKYVIFKNIGHGHVRDTMNYGYPN